MNLVTKKYIYILIKNSRSKYRADQLDLKHQRGSKVRLIYETNFYLFFDQVSYPGVWLEALEDIR